MENENNSFESSLPQFTENTEITDSTPQAITPPTKKSKKKLYTALAGVFVVLVALAGAFGSGNFFQGALIFSTNVKQNIDLEYCAQNDLDSCVRLQLDQIKMLNVTSDKEITFGEPYLNFRDINLGIFRTTEVLELNPNFPSRFKLNNKQADKPLETVVLLTDTEIVNKLLEVGGVDLNFEDVYCEQNEIKEDPLNCEKFLTELVKNSSMIRLMLNEQSVDFAIPRLSFDIDDTNIQIDGAQINSLTRNLLNVSKLNNTEDKSLLIFSSDYPYFSQALIKLASGSTEESELNEEEEEEATEEEEVEAAEEAEEVVVAEEAAATEEEEEEEKDAEEAAATEEEEEEDVSNTTDTNPQPTNEPYVSVSDPAYKNVTLQSDDLSTNEKSEITKFFNLILESSLQEKTKTRPIGTLNIIDLKYTDVDTKTVQSVNGTSHNVTFILDTYNNEKHTETPLPFIPANNYFAETAIQTTFKTLL